MADCTKCANRNNDYCFFACENGESFKPITNANRLRAKSDEELAEWLSCNCTGDGYGNSAEDWLEWLRQEAEP